MLQNISIQQTHSDHLGSSSLITDANGQLDQHYQYLPFSRRDCADVRSTTQLARPNPDEPSSELRQGGEPFVSQKINTGVRFTFSGKERDSETDYSYFGARYYTSDLGVWLSVDPKAHWYTSTSPYSFVENNPIMYIDPNGMWKAEVLEDGSVNYQPESGDNAKTLASQYGLSIEDAEAILCQGGTGTISGEDVYNVLGTDLLKLDLKSDFATEQRIFDHLLFSRDYSVAKEGAFGFIPAEFYKNPGYGNPLEGIAYLNSSGVNVKVAYRVPWKRTSLDGTGEYYGMATNGTIKNVPGDRTTHFRVSDNLEIPILHPNTGNNFGDVARFTVDRKHSDILYNRYNKDLPYVPSTYFMNIKQKID